MIRMVVALLLLASCREAPSQKLTRLSGTAMTMEWRVQIGSPVANKEEVERIIKKSFREINQTYNRWNPYSELSKLNQLKAHTPVAISPNLAYFFSLTDEFVKLSGGRFDPSVEPLQHLWTSKLAKNHIPSQEEITPLLKAVGWHHFKIKEGFFTKDHDETAFDLGGIAKGHAVDFIAERLSIAGYANVYVEWGGEIRALGHKPNGDPWTVWISRDPDQKGNKKGGIAKVALDGQGLATSGNYDQFWVHREDDGTETTYLHVIDPKTGVPLTIQKEGFAAVSVLAPNCAIADALATTAMLFPTLQEAETWAKKVQEVYPTVKFWFLSK